LQDVASHGSQQVHELPLWHSIIQDIQDIQATYATCCPHTLLYRGSQRLMGLQQGRLRGKSYGTTVSWL
jgi:hypothetical protein